MGNREIKFRAWEEVNKVMHFDFRFIKSGNDGNDWLIFTSDKQTLKDSHHPFDNPWFQQQFKVMQYTGLKDVNGVEIYEGDVVDFYGVNCEVIWAESDASFFVESPDKSLCESGQEFSENCEVIGNIYQNPELLK